MSKTIIGGDTAVTLSASTVSALTSLGVSISGYGSATLAKDAKGDDVASFAITGGFDGEANQVILHQGGGLTFSDSKGSITVSNLRIDTQHHAVYADVKVTANGVVTTKSDVAVFNLGTGDALTFTAAGVAAVNKALGSALGTTLALGVAAPSPLIDPLPAAIEKLTSLRDLFGDHGYAGGIEPIVGGVTHVTLTAAAELASLGVTVAKTGTAKLLKGASDPVLAFRITGGDEQKSGDTILHQDSGFKLSDAYGTVKLQNLIVDTVHGVVDADVTVKGHFAGEIAVFTLGAGDSLTLTSAAAGALDSALHLGSALTGSTVIGSASTHPFALTHHEAAVLANLAPVA